MLEVQTLSEYIDQVGRQLERWQSRAEVPLEPVFRGQASAHWELTPALLRASPYSKQMEDRLLREFQRGARPFLKQVPLGRLQWMALGQHHGLPTRLLDWSESALVALYFALQEHHAFDGRDPYALDCDPCVWLLNRNVLHERFRLPGQLILIDAAEREWPAELQSLVQGESEGVVVFTPAHISSRMPVQKAAFTLFGSSPDALEKLREDPWLLRRLVIPRARVRAVRRELELAGITRSTLFPDLDGVAGEVWEREVRRRESQREGW